MRSWQKYYGIIARIVPAGAVGASVLLGSTIGNAAAVRPISSPAATAPGVSERLAAIREAVFAVVEPDAGDGLGSGHPDPDFRLIWGNRWNNWGWGGRPGWGRPAWNNWRNYRPRWNNWNNAWRNW